MADDDSRTLKPAKMATSAENKLPVDRFGQSYKSDDDSSKWSDTGPALSRKVHSRSDVDLSSRSFHHTLGIKHSQASPGDHIHDGIMSKKLGPVQLLSGGAGTEPAWSLPDSYTLEDVVDLIAKFVDFRVDTGPGNQSETELISFTTLSLYTLPIVFPQAYPVGIVPKVFTNIVSSAGVTTRWGSRAYATTNTQFTLFLFKGDAADSAQTWASIPVQWYSTI